MRKNIILGISLWICVGCTTPSYYYKSKTLNLKRNQDIVNVDIANQIPESKLAVSVSYQYALSKPEKRVNRGTIISNKDFQIMTTAINSSVYESRSALSGEISYGIKDELSAGVLLDASFGDVGIKNEILDKSTVDVGFYLRALDRFGNFVFGVRPELLLSTLNGTKTVTDSSGTINGELHEMFVSERISVFTRYNINDRIGIFLGGQQKRVVFSEKQDEMQFENVFACYAGVSIKYGLFEFATYLGIPVTSDYTKSKSPLQLSIKVVCQFKKPMKT
jgi:hypothetical protein